MKQWTKWDYIKQFFKELFCNHDWEKGYIGAYNHDYLYCTKCNKQKEID